MKTLTRYFRIDRRGDSGPYVRVLHARRAPAERCICGRMIEGLPDFSSAKGVLEGGTFSGKDYDNIGGIGSVVWSERAVGAFEQAGLDGFRAYPISIYELGASSPLVDWGFCAIKISGKLDFDRGLFDNFEGDLCPKCGSWRPAGNAQYGPKIMCPILSDPIYPAFCKGRNITAHNVFCTKEVVEVFTQVELRGFGVAATAPPFGRINHREPGWHAAFCRRVGEVYPQLV